jgi:hypothetical protein
LSGWVPVVQQVFISIKTTFEMITMIIVGQVSSKEEANEITFIAKLFIVGQRARFLALHKHVDSVDDEEAPEEDEKDN